MLRFAPIRVFTNATIFWSNPLTFPFNSELKPSFSSNSGGSGDSKLLLLLSSPKASNPPNGFTSIVPKCRKYLLLIFPMFIIFCY